MLAYMSTHPALAAAVLALAVVVMRLIYAVVSRLVAPYPRARAVVEAVAALAPDVLRAVLYVLRAATGLPLPSPDLDARDAELARLRAALAMSQSDVMALRATRIAPPVPVDPQAGHIRAAAMGVLLLIASALATLRCRPATDAGYALAGLPAATQCTAREYRCNAGMPEVCERGNTTTGALRWWPTVPPGPDGRRVPCARCVVDVDGGRAHCGAVDAALATDGGAP